MDSSQGPQSGINSWFEDELLQQYRVDRGSVDKDWKNIFEHPPANGGGNGTANGSTCLPAAPANGSVITAAHEPVLSPSEELMPLRGAPARIAENMAASAAIPLATSQRIIPVKVIDENRRLINHHRTLLGKSKLSYTHIIGWAIVKSVQANPALNHAFASNPAGELFRVLKKEINFGLAVDVAGKNGARSLLVPNIKNAGALTFTQYVAAFEDLVARARTGKLTLPDFQGTSISLTNPGTVGTMASMPRLVPGQGAIIAVGAMDYPAEYRGVAPDVITSLGISKVMSVTCTYDHRVIQGAESGMFLGTLQSLLDGADGFYEEVFEALHIPYMPVKWSPDVSAAESAAAAEPSIEIVREAKVAQLVHAFRVRGHLMADLDPLGEEPAYNAELDPLTYGLTITGISTGTSIQAQCSMHSAGANRPLCVKWSTACAKTTAAKSAPSTCTSSGPMRKPGCRSASSSHPPLFPMTKSCGFWRIFSRPKSSSTSSTGASSARSVFPWKARKQPYRSSPNWLISRPTTAAKN